MWLIKQITAYFQKNCKHPQMFIHLDVRIDKPLEKHNQWRVEWCQLCGAIRNTRTMATAGATVKSATEWQSPDANDWRNK